MTASVGLALDIFLRDYFSRRKENHFNSGGCTRYTSLVLNSFVLFLWFVDLMWTTLYRNLCKSLLDNQNFHLKKYLHSDALLKYDLYSLNSQEKQPVLTQLIESKKRLSVASCREAERYIVSVAGQILKSRFS